MDPTLLPPKASLRGALMFVHDEVGGVLPDGDMNLQAQTVVELLKLIVGRYRELATNGDRRKAMLKGASVAMKENIQKVVSRVVTEQTSWTPNSRRLSTSSVSSSSHTSMGDARLFDDDAELEAELAILGEDVSWPTSQEVLREDEWDAEITELEKEEFGIHPSPWS